MRFDTPGPLLLRLWRRLSPLPGGRWLFARILGLLVPYSGTIGATIVHLHEGDVELRLRDRRRVRNHLASIHAVALVNLGEIAGGLAVLTALPPGVRGIPVRLDTEYLRKARGELRAIGRFVPSPFEGETEIDIQVPILDASNEVVARVTATWRLRAPTPTGA